MLESNLKIINNDVKTLVKNAQSLLQAAAALTGDQAKDAHDRGMHLLDTALTRVHDMQSSVVDTGQEMATSADQYVKQNPWRTIVTAIGIGLLAGVVLGRR